MYFAFVRFFIFFFLEELQGIQVDPHGMYKIEKIIKTRKRPRTEKEVLVR